MIDFEKIESILKTTGSLSFYGLAELYVGSRDLCDFTWVQLLARDFERVLPTLPWLQVESGLVSLVPAARME